MGQDHLVLTHFILQDKFMRYDGLLGPCTYTPISSSLASLFDLANKENKEDAHGRQNSR